MSSNHSPELLAAISEYQRVFGEVPDVAVFAPGRVNLIGEHTDYNDGFVLPFALPFRTIIVGKKSSRKDSSCQIYSCNIKDASAGPFTFKANSSLTKSLTTWTNYVTGVVFQYLDEIPKDASFDAVITSNVPLGSGLSSSAALEVATATFLEKLFDITTVSNIGKALRCQKAEHTFADTPCGIMDQFVSVLGRKNNLLLLDCRTRNGALVPFGGAADKPVVLISNSNVKHKLSGSEYPDRVRQCREAVEVLRATDNRITALRDVSITQLNAAMEAMGEPVYSRALHVVSENDRTEAAAAALRAGDWHEVGRLMTESHFSLQKNYEVSCPELDALVNIAVPFPGVFGSRMTGGGFGGCTVTLLEKSAVDGLMNHMKNEYRKQTGKICTFYVVEPEEGAGILELPTTPKQAPVAPANSMPLTDGSAPFAHPPVGSGGKCPFSAASDSIRATVTPKTAFQWWLPMGLLVVAVGLSYIIDKH